MTGIEEVNLKKILPSNGPSINEVGKYLKKYRLEIFEFKSAFIRRPCFLKINILADQYIHLNILCLYFRM